MREESRTLFFSFFCLCLLLSLCRGGGAPPWNWFPVCGLIYVQTLFPTRPAANVNWPCLHACSRTHTNVPMHHWRSSSFTHATHVHALTHATRLSPACKGDNTRCFCSLSNIKAVMWSIFGIPYPVRDESRRWLKNIQLPFRKIFVSQAALSSSIILICRCCFQQHREKDRFINMLSNYWNIIKEDTKHAIIDTIVRRYALYFVDATITRKQHIRYPYYIYISCLLFALSRRPSLTLFTIFHYSLLSLFCLLLFLPVSWLLFFLLWIYFFSLYFITSSPLLFWLSFFLRFSLRLRDYASASRKTSCRPRRR